MIRHDLEFTEQVLAFIDQFVSLDGERPVSCYTQEDHRVCTSESMPCLQCIELWEQLLAADAQANPLHDGRKVACEQCMCWRCVCYREGHLWDVCLLQRGACVESVSVTLDGTGVRQFGATTQLHDTVRTQVRLYRAMYATIVRCISVLTLRRIILHYEFMPCQTRQNKDKSACRSNSVHHSSRYTFQG